MEKLIGSFFLLFILLSLYLKSFSIKKRYFRKSILYRKKIQKIKSKINVLDSRLEINSFEKKEVDDLSKQVLDLHKLIFKKYNK